VERSQRGFAMCRQGSLSSFLSSSGIVLILALCISAHAQSNATLSGRVVDPNGASVSGARITAVNSASSATRVAESDHDGNYLLPALPVGNYRLRSDVLAFKRRSSRSSLWKCVFGRATECLEMGKRSASTLKLAQVRSGKPLRVWA